MRNPDNKIMPGSFGDMHLALHLVVVVVGFQLELIVVSHCEKEIRFVA